MTSEQVRAERARMDARAKVNGRVKELEKRLDAQAVAIKALSNLINSVKELSKAELAYEVDELEKRIKHLEAVAYEEGEPEGHGLVEDVQ